MTVGELKLVGASKLKGSYPPEEIQSFFSLLAEVFLKFSRIETVLQSDTVVSKRVQSQFSEAYDRLANHEPIQYIIGHTEFYGLQFFVNQHTLIPRPETEELVTWVLETISKNESECLSMLDVGTGTGCIPISVGKNTTVTKLSAVDISVEALKIAKKNAQLHEVLLECLTIDILNANELPDNYDIIVSNPPYVRNLEKQWMQPNVLEHEPDVALFVSDENPLVFYVAIAKLAQKHLTSKGLLFFEINEYLSEEMSLMLRGLGFLNIEVRNDMFGKKRMVKCSVK